MSSTSHAEESEAANEATRIAESRARFGVMSPMWAAAVALITMDAKK